MHGYERTTIRAIAAQLELTDPAIYYHFASKRILLNHVLQEFPDAMRDVPPEPPSERDELVERIYRLFYRYSEKAAFARLLFRQQYDGDEPADERRITGRRQFHEAIEADMRRLYGTRAGVVADGVRLLLSGLLWDAMLTHGNACGEVLAQEAFRARVRALIDLSLPHVEPSPGGTPPP